MLTVSDVEARVRVALAGPLPGPTAQMTMVPRPRVGEPPARAPGSRRAAALILVYPQPVEAHLLLTVRAVTLPQHAGQVSLPGGALDAGETAEDAALREAQEEVGVDPSRVRILGALSTVHIPISRFSVRPIVAVTSAPLELRPDTREVARLLEIPITELMDPTRVRLTHWPIRDCDHDIPYFDLQGEVVWGATAMMLAEFVQVMNT
ncbi:MAG: NUDIX domain-containing protein [Luteitalea sp.]|nr:NUDIX domain-containing protein [Luteitalea sp.]